MVNNKCAAYNIMVVIKKEYQLNLWMGYSRCLSNREFIKILLNIRWLKKFNKKDDLFRKIYNLNTFYDHFIFRGVNKRAYYFNLVNSFSYSWYS